MRASPTGPRPKRSGRTATTAFCTLTFRYTLILVTLTTVVRLMTTLLTTRGPPQPPHQARPTKPGRPHHGTHGSPQPSATQLTKGAPMLTRMPGAPKKATSAGAYTGRTTTGPGAQAQTRSRCTQRP